MLCSYSVMEELIAYEIWHRVMWPKWRRSRQDLAWWTGCNGEGQVKALKRGTARRWSLGKIWRQWTEATVKSEQGQDRWTKEGHVIIWSGSYHSRKIKPSVDSWWWSKGSMKVGACVASTFQKMKWNAQGKGMTCRAFHFTGQRLCREVHDRI